MKWLAMLGRFWFALMFVALVGATGLAQESSHRPPNVVLIYMDDMGYGDLGCYGSQVNKTPRIDQLAEEGMRFTDFYSTSGVCTPSRASLLTGCYPRRVNMHVDENDLWVLFPVAKKGLHPDEVTIAEVLRDQGYATACIGKWHLGDQPQFLPTSQGFDEYFGIPYSNDMNREKAPLPLLRNSEVIEAPVEQPSVTRRYTDEAIAFIERNAHQPFFLYLPHTAVHLPLFPGEDFEGRSENGKYGDWLAEVDASTGELMDKLKSLELDANTLVIFASDNGATGGRGSSNAPLTGRKGNTDEGSMRIPCVMRWPERIAAGTSCSELAATIDLLPTLAAICVGELPSDREIDGVDIQDLLFGKETDSSPKRGFYYYHTSQLQAVRSEQWKLVLPLKEKRRGWSNKELDTPLQLFDLQRDIGEQQDVAHEHPEIVKQLLEMAERAREVLGDENREGSGQRKAGWVENPQPLLLQR